jgi:hypothetical protein
MGKELEALSAKLRATRNRDESGLWGQMSRMTPLGIRIHRMEVRHPAGFPDCIWWAPSRGGNSSIGMLELKDSDPEIRPQQRIFLQAAHLDGQSAFVLLRQGPTIRLINPQLIKTDLKIGNLPGVLAVNTDDLGPREAWGQIWDFLVPTTRGYDT